MATADTTPTPTRTQRAAQAQPLRHPQRLLRRLILHLHHPRRPIPRLRLLLQLILQPRHLHQPTLPLRRLRRPIRLFRHLHQLILRSRHLRRPIPPHHRLLHHPGRLATLIRPSRAILALLHQSTRLDTIRTLLLTHLTPAPRTRTLTRLIRLATQQATQRLPRRPSPLPTHQEGFQPPRP